MSMVTRCPHCGTSFRITSDLLKARHGLVRCGHCAQVFNAFDSLSTVHEVPERKTGEEAIIEVPPPSEEEPASEVPEEPAPPLPEAAAPEPETDEEPPTEEALIEEFFVGEKPSKFGWTWGAGSALLALLLFAQGIYYFRTEIGISMPSSKPFLQSYCRMLDCTLPLPGKIDLIGIESSSLHAEPGRVGVIDLHASIRNSAPFSQQYPLLELTLTDAQDAPIARKVFAPSDYLPKDIGVEEGIPANADVNVGLDLDTGSLLPNGYRLYLFYP